MVADRDESASLDRSLHEADPAAAVAAGDCQHCGRPRDGAVLVCPHCAERPVPLQSPVKRPVYHSDLRHPGPQTRGSEPRQESTSMLTLLVASVLVVGTLIGLCIYIATRPDADVAASAGTVLALVGCVGIGAMRLWNWSRGE